MLSSVLFGWLRYHEQYILIVGVGTNHAWYILMVGLGITHDTKYLLIGLDNTLGTYLVGSVTMHGTKYLSVLILGITHSKGSI